MTKIYARTQKQVEHEIRQMLGKVQDEVTERWSPRLRVASRASGGRKNPRRGTTCDLHSRIRLGHSEGLNKACVGGGGERGGSGQARGRGSRLPHQGERLGVWISIWVGGMGDG